MGAPTADEASGSWRQALSGASARKRLGRARSMMAATARRFSKSTTIINIGHLPGHTTGKEALLREHGWTNVKSILCEKTPAEEIKRELKAAATPEGALFLVGGAMMKGFPDLMQDLLQYVAANCPTILVHKTVAADFDKEVTFPPGPSEAQVNKSAINICMRYLAEGKTW